MIHPCYARRLDIGFEARDRAWSGHVRERFSIRFFFNRFNLLIRVNSSLKVVNEFDGIFFFFFYL